MTPVTALGDSIRVNHFDTYSNCEDGFIFFWGLEDCDGQSSTVGLDDRKVSPTRNRLYQGARHPKQEGCVWIELGSIEEGIIVPTLSRWLDASETWKPARTNRAFEDVLEEVQQALLQHGASI